MTFDLSQFYMIKRTFHLLLNKCYSYKLLLLHVWFVTVGWLGWLKTSTLLPQFVESLEFEGGHTDAEDTLR